MRNSIFFILLLLFLLPAESKGMVMDADSLFFENHISEFEQYQSLPMGELMIKSASLFIGKPYVASTLDKSDKEELVVNLREFDCTTFVETCLALTGTIKSQDYSFAQFKRLLQIIRYRDGIIDGYSSRLHYVSDWIYDNSDMDVLRDITDNLGDVLERKEGNINFMTTHPHLYKQLKDDKGMLSKMKEVESVINKRGGYYHIPKKNIPKIESQIKDGDIIVFATLTKGLDYSHIGIAYHDEGKLTFIHASTRSKDVTIESRSLYEYCSKSANCTGITVLRVKE